MDRPKTGVTDHVTMDAVRLGRSLRVLRRRRGMSQASLGSAAGVSRETVSRIERGAAGTVRLDTLVEVAAALGAVVNVSVLWRGEALARLLDAAHADLVGRVVSRLGEMGWETAVEVTFARYGERGAIDVFGRHAATGAVLVVEVKSVIPDLQAMLGTLDRKARLAPHVAAERGWGRPTAVGRLLVVPGGRTVRRRIATHRTVLDIAFPDRGREVTRWLRDPRGRPLAGILAIPGDGR